MKRGALESNSLDSDPNSSRIRRVWSSSFTSSCLSPFIHKNDHKLSTQLIRLFQNLNKIMHLNHRNCMYHSKNSVNINTFLLVFIVSGVVIAMWDVGGVVDSVVHFVRGVDV